VSNQVHWLANELAAQGHEPTCYSFSPRPADARYGHEQLSSVSQSKISKKFAPSLAFSRINTKKYDIVHYHGDDYLCRGQAKRVRTFYGSALGEARAAKSVGRFFYQALFYAFEIVSCIRQGTKVGISRSTRRYLPWIETVIPCGVPLQQFTCSHQETEYPSILFLGDFQSRKRGDYLLHVFEKHVVPVMPSARLVVVGPERRSAANVECKGNVDSRTLISLYQSAWVYCMVSAYEGFGVPAIEAMACGAVVVAIDNPGIRDIVTDGHDGSICSSADFPHTLNRILSDAQLRDRLRSNGLRTVARFDIGAVAREYLRVYERCVSREGGALL
jgi:glycosyltransferase involved in cell wall biosynthesis